MKQATKTQLVFEIVCFVVTSSLFMAFSKNFQFYKSIQESVHPLCKGDEAGRAMVLLGLSQLLYMPTREINPHCWWCSFKRLCGWNVHENSLLVVQDNEIQLEEKS